MAPKHRTLIQILAATLALTGMISANAAVLRCNASAAAVGLTFASPALPHAASASMNDGITEAQMATQLRMSGFSPVQAQQIAAALDTALMRLQANPSASNADLVAGSMYPATVMFRRACQSN